MGKLIVIAVSVLCVLGIITVSQYINVCEWAVVGAIRSYVFWVIAGSLMAVLVGVLKLFGFRG